MAYLTETKDPAIWEEGIYRIELTDPVVGGEDGISNVQARQLANRTVFLKEQIDDFLSSTSAGIVERVATLEGKLETNSDSVTNRVASLESAKTSVEATASAAATASVEAKTTADAAQVSANTNLASINWIKSCMPSNWYQRSSMPYAFTAAGSTGCNKIVIPAGLVVAIDGTIYRTTEDVTYDINTASTWDENTDSIYINSNFRAGKDFYIYACKPATGEAPKIVFSANSTYPVGYTTETGPSDTRKIGGFHCLCLYVGTVSGHKLSNFSTGDIIPNSVWDLKYTPLSSPEGMVCIGGRFWVDIYLNSLSADGILESKFGGSIADGASATTFHAEKFVEMYASQKKRLPTRDEFIALAAGSNQGTAIKTAEDVGFAGGHYDTTTTTRMVSTWGVEDCCGFMWQWTGDIFGAFNKVATADTPQYGGESAETSLYYLDGYQWDAANRSVYNEYVDGSRYTSGGVYGALSRAKVGGSWTDSVNCGPRAVNLASLSSWSDAATAARGVSEFKHWDN